MSFRAMVCNRLPTWPSATVKKPSGRSVCWGRRQRGTPSSGSLKWCLPETSDPPLLASTSGSYLWESKSPCPPAPSSLCVCAGQSRTKTVREAMVVWFGRTPGAGFSANWRWMWQQADSTEQWRDQNSMQGSLWTLFCFMALLINPKKTHEAGKLHNDMIYKYNSF